MVVEAAWEWDLRPAYRPAFLESSDVSKPQFPYLFRGMTVPMPRGSATTRVERLVPVRSLRNKLQGLVFLDVRSLPEGQFPHAEVGCSRKSFGEEVLPAQIAEKVTNPTSLGVQGNI